MIKLFRWQIIVLVIGTLFAWYTVVVDFIRFFDVEGTLFRVKECAVPNPVTTPCFWGAWAFLIALLWAVYIFKQVGDKQRKHQVRLVWLLIAGTIFAWSNMTLEFIRFYSNQGNPTVGCSGQVVSNPFLTPCFIGAALFLAALIVGILALVKSKKATMTTPQS